MTIPVTCDSCFHAFPAPDRALGKRIRCPACQEPVRVAAEGAGNLAAAGAPPAMKKRSAGPPPVARKPQSKKSKSRPAKSSPSRWPLFAAIGGGVAGLGLLIFLAVTFVKLPSGSSSTAGSQSTRKISREQKEFTAGTDLAISATTSEWFKSLKKYHSTDNRMQRTLMKAKLGNAETALGPDPAALPIVFEAVADQHLKRYAEAILKKFGQSPEPPYFVDVIEGLQSETEAVRGWAAKLLAYVRVEDGETIVRMTEYLNGGDPAISASAATALGHMGPEAFPALHAALQRQAAKPPVEILQSLIVQGAAAAAAVPDLVPLLSDDHVLLRPHVLGALAAIGPPSKGALPEMKRILLAEEIDAKWQGALGDALVKIGGESLPSLIEVITGGPSGAQAFAIRTAGRLEAAAVPAAPAIIGSLGSVVEEVRNAANEVLPQLLPQANPTGEQLQQVFQQAKPSLQLWALDEIAADSQGLAAAGPRIQATRGTVAAAHQQWTSTTARLEAEKSVIYTSFRNGERDYDAERRHKEDLDRRHGEAAAQADAYGKLLQRIDQVLQQAEAA